MSENDHVELVDAVVAVALPSGQSEQAPVPVLDLCVHICLHRLGCHANWRLLAMTKCFKVQVLEKLSERSGFPPARE